MKFRSIILCSSFITWMFKPITSTKTKLSGKGKRENMWLKHAYPKEEPRRRDNLGADWLFRNTGTIRLVEDDDDEDNNKLTPEVCGVMGGVFLVSSSRSYTTRLTTRSGKICRDRSVNSICLKLELTKSIRKKALFYCQSRSTSYFTQYHHYSGSESENHLIHNYPYSIF